jgi:hypothetical protein
MMSPFCFPTILKMFAFCTVLSLAGCSKEVPLEATETLAQGGMTPVAETVNFTGEVEYHPVDANADGYYERLEAVVKLEILKSGEYLILGTLEKDGKQIANRPAYESMLFSNANISAETGIATAAISFSGEQILLSGEDGPFDLVLHAIGDSGLTSITVQTPKFDHAQFAEIGAVLVEVRNAVVDADVDGKIESILSTVEVEVRTPGDYYLQGNVRRGTLEVNTGSRFTLSSGLHHLELSFSIPPVSRAELIQPLEGVVNILDVRQHMLASLEFLIDTFSLEKQ